MDVDELLFLEQWFDLNLIDSIKACLSLLIVLCTCITTCSVQFVVRRFHLKCDEKCDWLWKDCLTKVLLAHVSFSINKAPFR